MAKVLIVNLAGGGYHDQHEGDNLTFECDGDGDLVIRDGRDEVAAYARGQWSSVVPPTVKRSRRT